MFVWTTRHLFFILEIAQQNCVLLLVKLCKTRFICPLKLVYFATLQYVFEIEWTRYLMSIDKDSLICYF